MTAAAISFNSSKVAITYGKETTYLRRKVELGTLGFKHRVFHWKGDVEAIDAFQKKLSAFRVG